MRMRTLATIGVSFILLCSCATEIDDLRGGLGQGASSKKGANLSSIDDCPTSYVTITYGAKGRITRDFDEKRLANVKVTLGGSSTKTSSTGWYEISASASVYCSGYPAPDSVVDEICLDSPHYKKKCFRQTFHDLGIYKINIVASANPLGRIVSVGEAFSSSKGLRRRIQLKEVHDFPDGELELDVCIDDCTDKTTNVSAGALGINNEVNIVGGTLKATKPLIKNISSLKAKNKDDMIVSGELIDIQESRRDGKGQKVQNLLIRKPSNHFGDEVIATICLEDCKSSPTTKLPSKRLQIKQKLRLLDLTYSARKNRFTGVGSIEITRNAPEIDITGVVESVKAIRTTSKGQKAQDVHLKKVTGHTKSTLIVKLCLAECGDAPVSNIDVGALAVGQQVKVVGGEIVSSKNKVVNTEKLLVKSSSDKRVKGEIAKIATRNDGKGQKVKDINLINVEGHYTDILLKICVDKCNVDPKTNIKTSLEVGDTISTEGGQLKALKNKITGVKTIK